MTSNSVAYYSSTKSVYIFRIRMAYLSQIEELFSNFIEFNGRTLVLGCLYCIAFKMGFSYTWFKACKLPTFKLHHCYIEWNK